MHMDGKRHRKHIAMAEVTSSLTEDTGADGEELHCELCDVTVPSSTHKQIHLRCPSLPLSFHIHAYQSKCVHFTLCRTEMSCQSGGLGDCEYITWYVAND